MIEELTPQVMMIAMVLIIAISSIATLILSALLLWRYRRFVSRAMALQGGFKDQAETASAASIGTALTDRTKFSGTDLLQQVIHAPRRSAMGFLIAGLAFAMVFALAAQFVYPTGLALPGFLVAVWIYFWPAILALPLIIPGSMRFWFLLVCVYALVFSLLGMLATSVTNLPEYRFGGIYIQARSTVTPWGMVRLWLVVNGAPTTLIWLCFNRRIRAVAPLMLALVTTVTTGVVVVYLSIFSKPGVDLFVSLSVSLDLHVFGLVASALLLSLLGFSLLGWMLVSAIARVYRRRGVSDRSLLLDALLLLFANSYGMWLVIGGTGWFVMVPTAFLVYRLILSLAARVVNGRFPVAQGLTFLRVFSLGRRSDALLGDVAGYWRYLGSVQVITGPDVVHSTVQPHQFLDFLSGRMDTHFVHDIQSMELSLAERNRMPDPDGRYRINNFFCYEDSWQPLLSQLVQAGDIVLMDLRSFTAANAGCIHELRLLVREVPFNQCLLLVDSTTDEVFLRTTLKESWERLPQDTPNRNRLPDEVATFRYERGVPQLQRMIGRLCRAAQG